MHYYRGKHYKKRFGPTVDKYKTQLINYFFKLKYKLNPIFNWFASLIHKHDEWWDSVELRLGAFIDKHWRWLSREIHIIKILIEEFK